jgi:hypothetical protein
VIKRGKERILFDTLFGTIFLTQYAITIVFNENSILQLQFKSYRKKMQLQLSMNTSLGLKPLFINKENYLIMKQRG